MGGTCSAYGERSGVYRVLVGKPEGKSPGLAGRIMQCLVENTLFYFISFHFLYFIYVGSILRKGGCISQSNKQEVQITYHSHSNSKQLKLQKTVAR